MRYFKGDVVVWLGKKNEFEANDLTAGKPCIVDRVDTYPEGQNLWLNNDKGKHQVIKADEVEPHSFDLEVRKSHDALVDFADAFRDFQREAHQVAKDKGWYDPPIKTPLESLMLVVSELGEAAEELRHDRAHLYFRGPAGTDDELKQEYIGNPEVKPEGLASELADVVLRLADLCEHMGIDLAQAIVLKHQYNMTRPYRHGKKI